jgi:hypothetical protein
MSCGGGHLGFPIGIKNRFLVKDITMIILSQFGFSQFLSFREEETLGFLFRYEIRHYGKNVSKRFFYETSWTIETKLPRNDHWKVLYKVSVFFIKFFFRGPSNDYSWAVWFKLSKWFKRRSILKICSHSVQC